MSMPKGLGKIDLRAYAAVAPLVLATTLMWAASVPLIRAAVSRGFPPVTLAAVRWLFASILLLCIALLREKPRAWLSVVQDMKIVRLVLVFAVIDVVVPNVLQNLGLERTSAPLASVILSSTPVFTVAFGVLLLRESWGLRKALGLTVALTSAALLAVPGGKLTGGSLAGNLLLLLASVCWGAADYVGKVALSTVQPLVFLSLGFLVGGLILLPTALIFESGFSNLLALDGQVWLIVLLLSVFPSCFAYALYYRAMGRIEVSKLVIFVYLIPLWSIAMSYVLLGETIDLISIGLGALVAGGIAVAQSQAERMVHTTSQPSDVSG